MISVIDRRLVVCGVLALGACSSASAPTNSVLERNNHPSRDGAFVQAALSKAAVANMAFDTGFSATFPGVMFASPLYLENGPHGKGVFFAVTTGNDVFALDEATGAVVWTTNIGPSAQASGAGCGSIHPIGILSTPVIDAQSRTIYVAGAIGTAAIDRHEIHALSVDDGSERKGWPIDTTGVSSGTVTFMPQPENQRSALSLLNGILYVAYGGHVGDCGPYHGWVIAVDTRDPTKVAGWASGGQGEGIWASGGMASDGKSIFAVTGNATSGTTVHLDSEEVVRLSGLAALDRSTVKNFYFPAAWPAMDSADQDFGSNSPVYVEIPGATPSTFVAAVSKNGHLYLLDSKNLGGMNGHVVDYPIPSGSVAVHAPLAAYTTALGGVHLIFPTDVGVPCPAASTTPGMVSIALAAGAPPQPRLAWCAPIGTRVGAITTSTTSDPKSADVIVWYVDNGQLVARDADSGALLYQDATATCPGVLQWTSPIAVKGRIIAGADGRLCSWSPHPVVDAATTAD